MKIKKITFTLKSIFRLFSSQSFKKYKIIEKICVRKIESESSLSIDIIAPGAKQYTAMPDFPL